MADQKVSRLSHKNWLSLNGRYQLSKGHKCSWLKLLYVIFQVLYPQKCSFSALHPPRAPLSAEASCNHTFTALLHTHQKSSWYKRFQPTDCSGYYNSLASVLSSSWSHDSEAVKKVFIIWNDNREWGQPLKPLVPPDTDFQHFAELYPATPHFYSSKHTT